MRKSSQKTAGADQPANQRGKSRFGTSGRPARVVLPERPPRAVDNEIVSILLGADPAALTTQAEGVKSAVPAEASPSLTPVESSAVTTGPTVMGAAPVDDFEATCGHTESAPADHTTVEDKALTPNTDISTEAVQASLPPPREVVAPPSAQARRAPSASNARPADARATAGVQEFLPGAGTVPSFEEFAERWKHGLRKGQLKVCEVLYQKTYAVGRTECVTSFSELGRLSGLKMRQCFNIIAQLEALRFVERSRSASTSNKKDQGSVIRFHLYPAQ